MWDVSLSHCCSWGFKSSGMWHWVLVWVVTDVSFTFTLKRCGTSCLLKIEVLRSFSMSEPLTQRHSIIFQKMWIPKVKIACAEGEQWHRSCDCTITGGHAIGQAHQRLLTTEACVQTRGSSLGFCIEQVDIGAGFHLRFSCYNSTKAPCLSVIRSWCNRPQNQATQVWLLHPNKIL
jgi:hypothetical protein